MKHWSLINVVAAAPAAIPQPPVDPKEDLRQFVKNHSTPSGGSWSPTPKPGALEQYNALKQKYGPQFDSHFKQTVLDHGMSPHEFHSSLQTANYVEPEQPQQVPPAEGSEPNLIQKSVVDSRADTPAEEWFKPALDQVFAKIVQNPQFVEIASKNDVFMQGVEKLFERKTRGGGNIKKWQTWLVSSGFFRDVNAVKRALNADMVSSGGKPAVDSGSSVLKALEDSIFSQQEKFAQEVIRIGKFDGGVGVSANDDLGSDKSSSMIDFKTYDDNVRAIRDSIEDDPNSVVPREMRWNVLRKAAGEIPHQIEVDTAENISAAFSQSQANEVIMQRLKTATDPKGQPYSKNIRGYDEVLKEALIWPILGIDDISGQDSFANWKRFAGVTRDIGMGEEDDEEMIADDLQRHLLPILQKAQSGDPELQKWILSKATSYLQKAMEFQNANSALDTGHFTPNIQAVRGLGRVQKMAAGYLQREARTALAFEKASNKKPRSGSALRRWAMVSTRGPMMLEAIEKALLATRRSGQGRTEEEIEQQGYIPLIKKKDDEEARDITKATEIQYLVRHNDGLYIQTAVHKPNGQIVWKDEAEPITYANMSSLSYIVSPQIWAHSALKKIEENPGFSFALEKREGGSLEKAQWSEEVPKTNNPVGDLDAWRKARGSQLQKVLAQRGLSPEQVAEAVVKGRNAKGVGARIGGKDKSGKPLALEWINNILNGSPTKYSDTDFMTLMNAINSLSPQSKINLSDIHTEHSHWYDKWRIEDLYELVGQYATALAPTGTYFSYRKLVEQARGTKNGTYNADTMYMFYMLHGMHASWSNPYNWAERGGTEQGEGRSIYEVTRNSVDQTIRSLFPKHYDPKHFDQSEKSLTDRENEMRGIVDKTQMPLPKSRMSSPRGVGRWDIIQNKDGSYSLQDKPIPDPKTMIDIAIKSMGQVPSGNGGSFLDDFKNWAATKSPGATVSNTAAVMSFFKDFNNQKINNEISQLSAEKDQIDQILQNNSPEEIEEAAKDHFIEHDPSSSEKVENFRQRYNGAKTEQEKASVLNDFNQLKNEFDARVDIFVDRQNASRSGQGLPELSRQQIMQNYLQNRSKYFELSIERLNSLIPQYNSVNHTSSPLEQYNKLVPLRLKTQMGNLLNKNNESIKVSPQQKPWDHLDSNPKKNNFQYPETSASNLMHKYLYSIKRFDSLPILRTVQSRKLAARIFSFEMSR